jgi:hypothetical protein
MSTFKWTSYNAADTAVAGASMNALANTAYALGAAIDNTSGLFLYGDISIVLSSAISLPAGSPPTVGIWILPSFDGTNYPTPPGATAGVAPANLLAGTIAMVASTSTSIMMARGLVLPPAKFKVLIQNGLGVAFPSTNTSTCLLYRYGEQAV